MLKPTYNAAGLNQEALLWAIKALQEKTTQYQLARDYYAGNHKLDFVTEKYKTAFGSALKAMKVNMCPTVVNTVNNRLRVSGFSVKLRAKVGKADSKANQTANDALLEATREIWEMNRMDTRACDLMKEAGKCGDAYLIVWPDPEAADQAVFYPQDAGTCAVQYHAEKPGYIVRAAKFWKEGKRVRLTIYTANEIEKYITSEDTESLPEKAEKFKRYVPSDESGEPRENWPLANPYGKCPVFHFGNGKERQSLLTDVIEPQNGLNLAICNLLVSMEFFSYPQRYAIGMVDEDDPDETNPEQWKAAMDRLWFLEDPNGKFGQFDPSSPQPFLDVKASFRDDIAVIAGIPPHYFTMTGGDIPSGVALQILEKRLSDLVEYLQLSWGAVWADAMLLALKMQKASVDNVRLASEWRNTEPQDTKAEAETQESKQRAGVSQTQSLREMGYSDTRIEEMRGERAEEQQSSADAMGKLFNAGAVGG